MSEETEIPYAELDRWTQQSFAPALNDRETELRDKFVDEYVVDYNGYAAALRCGFASAFADDYSKKFLSEPYVQKKLKQIEAARGGEKGDEYAKERVRAVLLREMEIGSPASRVAAANSLAKLLGMEPATKTISEVTVKSPVQFYLPSNGREAQPPVATEELPVEVKSE